MQDAVGWLIGIAIALFLLYKLSVVAIEHWPVTLFIACLAVAVYAIIRASRKAEQERRRLAKEDEEAAKRKKEEARISTLVPCVVCRQSISQVATTCPKCGTPRVVCRFCALPIHPSQLHQSNRYAKRAFQAHVGCLLLNFVAPSSFRCRACASHPSHFGTLAGITVLATSGCPSCGFPHAAFASTYHSTCHYCSLPIFDALRHRTVEEFYDSYSDFPDRESVHDFCSKAASRHLPHET